MKNINILVVLLLFTGAYAVGFGVYVQNTLDMREGVVLLSSISSILVGLLIISAAEIIRQLSNINRQLKER